MLERLLESKARRMRSAGGTMASVTAHTALIAAALYATAQARPVPVSRVETVRPIYFPAAPTSAPRAPSASAADNGQRTRIDRRLIFVDPINVVVPTPVDLTGMTTRMEDFRAGVGSPGNGRADDGIDRALPGTPFSAEQVEKQASLAPGNQSPRYPEALRSAGIEGSVTALFVVDAAGRVEEGSVRFVRSDNRLFEEAVRSALGRMRFIPAEVGGAKARQLVQMPFVFTLSR